MPLAGQKKFLPKGRNLVEINMKLAFKSIVATAAFVAAGAASAAATTVPVGGAINGLTLTGGSGTLSFSAALLDALNTGHVEITPYGAATPSSTRVFNPQTNFNEYKSASAAAPISSVSLESTTGQILVGSTTGGATQTSPVLSGVSTGGFITVADLSVDTTTQRVYTTIIGGNGVGTLSNYYLWDYTTFSGATNVTGAGDTVSTYGGLRMTTAGLALFNQALGLQKLGKLALTSVNDLTPGSGNPDGFGSITSTLKFSAAAVPEPSTYGLMALGLFGISLVARRRAK